MVANLVFRQCGQKSCSGFPAFASPGVFTPSSCATQFLLRGDLRYPCASTTRTEGWRKRDDRDRTYRTDDGMKFILHRSNYCLCAICVITGFRPGSKIFMGHFHQLIQQRQHTPTNDLKSPFEQSGNAFVLNLELYNI